MLLLRFEIVPHEIHDILHTHAIRRVSNAGESVNNFHRCLFVLIQPSHYIPLSRILFITPLIAMSHLHSEQTSSYTCLFTLPYYERRSTTRSWLLDCLNARLTCTRVLTVGWICTFARKCLRCLFHFSMALIDMNHRHEDYTKVDRPP